MPAPPTGPRLRGRIFAADISDYDTNAYDGLRAYAHEAPPELWTTP